MLLATVNEEGREQLFSPPHSDPVSCGHHTSSPAWQGVGDVGKNPCAITAKECFYSLARESKD